MKRINRLGPLSVVHNGQHFELPQRQSKCHGFSRTCRCDVCKRREAKQKRTALPWEQDFEDAA